MEVAAVGTAYSIYRVDPPAQTTQNDASSAPKTDATASSAGTTSTQTTRESQMRTDVTEYSVYDPQLGQYVNIQY